MNLLANGPIYRQSVYNPTDVKPIDFDPKKARELLRKAGWSDSDRNGVLDRTVDGKKYEFKFHIKS